MSMKSVAVIGAGVSGLCTIKSCLQEGLNVECFEASSELGGLWSYNEEENTEYNSVHYCTFMNSSKEISAFSDFVPPDYYPNFTRHNLVKEYLKSYAAHFDLVKFVHFRTKVTKVKKLKDKDEKAYWTVTTKNLNTMLETERTFSAVAICTGLLSKPHIPHINGIEKFKGDVIHSMSYKTASKFKDKNVLVVGIGNSAADIAVDLTHVAANVYLSTRRGAWVFHRSGQRGVPSDITMSTRFLHTCNRFLPRSITNWFMKWTLSQVLDHNLYGLEPKHKVLEHSPLINDDISFKVLNGSVVLKGDIQEFFPTGVQFQGNSKITKLDHIILATGFTQSFEYLDEELEVKDREGVSLYKQIFPPTEETHSIGFVGFIATFGPSNPMMEMQSRYFAAIISGKVTLPDTKTMLSDVKANQRLNRENLLKSARHIWYTEYLSYMDNLAEILGVKPNLWLMFFKDPALFLNCMFGPLLPYQYRLQGPHACSDARKNIFTYRQRIERPFQIFENANTKFSNT